MKKKITIVSVIALVCALSMALSGCFFTATPFDKLVTSITKNGRFDETNGTYTVTQYDLESDSVAKIIYNKADADKVTVVYQFNGDETKLFITKQKGNYKWEHNDSEYGLITGNINIEYKSNEPEFFEFDAFDIGTDDVEEVSRAKEIAKLAVEICLIELELHLLEKTFNTEVADFGIKLIMED